MKIEFWKTLTESYRVVFFDSARFCRVAGAWAILVATFSIVSTVIAAPVATSIFGFIAGIVKTAATTSFAVAWHRVILLDDVPQLSKTLRFGRREWRFLLNEFVIGLAYLIVTSVAMGAFYLSSSWLDLPFAFYGVSHFPLFFLPSTLLPNYLIVLVVCIWIAFLILARLNLAFPAVAIDRVGEPLDRAWRLSRGNGLRVSFGVLLGAAPIQVVNSGVHYVVRTTTGGTLISQPIDAAISSIDTFLVLIPFSCLRSEFHSYHLPIDSFPLARNIRALRYHYLLSRKPGDVSSEYPIA